MTERATGYDHSHEVACKRCRGTRWAYDRHGPPEEYVCIRCRAVLAGRNAVDPVASDDRKAILERARQARRIDSKTRSAPREGYDKGEAK